MSFLAWILPKEKKGPEGAFLKSTLQWWIISECTGNMPKSFLHGKMQLHFFSPPWLKLSCRKQTEWYQNTSQLWERWHGALVMKFINTEKRGCTLDSKICLSETNVLLIRADGTFRCLRTNWGQAGESTDQTKVTFVASAWFVSCVMGFCFPFSYICSRDNENSLKEYSHYYFFLKRHILMNRFFFTWVMKVKTKAKTWLLVERKEFVSFLLCDMKLKTKKILDLA